MDGEEVRHLQKNENINSLFIHSCGSSMWEGEGDIYHKQPFYISYFFFSEESLFPPSLTVVQTSRGGETSLRSACSLKQRAFHNCFLSPPSPDQQQVEVSAEHTHIHNMQPYIMRAILT